MVDKVLANIDWLVYSAHKSATRSIVDSMNASGFTAMSCHNIDHLMGQAEVDCNNLFRDFCKRYSHKLKVISVFREPLPRHVSSFFQFYGTKPLREKKVTDYKQTLLYKSTIPELIEIFCSQLAIQKFAGFKDSIHMLSESIRMGPADLKFDEFKKVNCNKFKTFDLYLFRFDQLVENFDDCLSEMSGRTILKKNSNRSQNKWYVDIYGEFKKELKVEPQVIKEIYEHKRDLGNVFYGVEGYDNLLNTALSRYSEG